MKNVSSRISGAADGPGFCSSNWSEPCTTLTNGGKVMMRESGVNEHFFLLFFLRL